MPSIDNLMAGLSNGAIVGIGRKPSSESQKTGSRTLAGENIKYLSNESSDFG